MNFSVQVRHETIGSSVVTVHQTPNSGIDTSDYTNFSVLKIIKPNRPSAFPLTTLRTQIPEPSPFGDNTGLAKPMRPRELPRLMDKE